MHYWQLFDVVMQYYYWPEMVNYLQDSCKHNVTAVYRKFILVLGMQYPYDLIYTYLKPQQYCYGNLEYF